MVPSTTFSALRALHALPRGVFDILMVVIVDRHQRFFEIALALPDCLGSVQTAVTHRSLPISAWQLQDAIN